MTAARFVEVHLGDVVRLRKDHPCGGTDWEVVRLGADIGLRCLKCHPRILLPRSQFERRLKTFVSHAEGPAEVDTSGLGGDDEGASPG